MRANLQEKIVYIVDDEPELREILSDEFSEFGAHCITASSVPEFLSKFSATPADLVITDMRMPGITGDVLIQKMVDECIVPPPIMVVTGYSDISDIDLFDLGASCFHKKPLDYESLLDNAARLVAPPQERWAKPVETGILFKLGSGRLSSEGQEQVSKIRFGRGGFFVGINGEMPGKHSHISFNLNLSGHSEFIGIGQILWCRPMAKDELPRGCGVEILFLNQDSLAHFQSILLNEPVKAYIPKQ